MRLSDQIRAAVDGSEMTRYAICKLTGIDQASMSRFMSGQARLGQDKLDRLADVLGLHVTKRKGR